MSHTHSYTIRIYASLSVLNPKSVYARLRVSEGRCEARRGEASIGRSCASCDDGGGGGGNARERSVVVDANDRVGENGDDDDDDDDAEDDEDDDDGEGDEDGDGGSRDARRGRAWERCCVRR